MSEPRNAQYHKVPAIAAPTWSPPKWNHFPSMARRSGQDVGARVAIQPMKLITCDWRSTIASAKFACAASAIDARFAPRLLHQRAETPYQSTTTFTASTSAIKRL